MKKLSTISLFIFAVVVIAILVAGLVFYQNKKDNQAVSTPSVNVISDTIKKTNPTTSSLVLNMQEITKHNKQSDCWMLIDGKVYNITSYFGSHPGGNSTMSATCGKDATAAYSTQDPYAAGTTTRSAHSSRAKSLLNNYYLGDLNQTVGL